MKELVALAKEKPDKLNYGSYGVGSQPHLLFEMLRKETGAEISRSPIAASRRRSPRRSRATCR